MSLMETPGQQTITPAMKKCSGLLDQVNGR
jgi:hypothetical protein